jgi:hypothetical protein
MANLDDLFKNDVAKGVAIGFGLAAAGWMLLPALRPVARQALKTGIVLAEKGREWAAETGEKFEDLLAEVQAELAEERTVAEAVAAARADEAATTAETAGTHG